MAPNGKSRFTLSGIDGSDLDELRALVAASVPGSVIDSEEETITLIDEIVRLLDRWMESGSVGFHRKCSIGDKAVGFIIVQDCWKLSHLFVLPEFRGHGIGRLLVEVAIRECRERSPRRKIELNSSSKAAGFYEAMGFRRTGPSFDRPGGCIPYEYRF
jgi:GNAT superfamily N-acetyltransferase